MADLICTAGGGIFGHPDGVTAGVSALRQAWDAAMRGIEIREHARTHPGAGQSPEFFGEILMPANQDKCKQGAAGCRTVAGLLR